MKKKRPHTSLESCHVGCWNFKHIPIATRTIFTGVSLEGFYSKLTDALKREPMVQDGYETTPAFLELDLEIAFSARSSLSPRL